MNRFAPDGEVFVCACCGKQSRDLYGSEAISAGWDESCMLNAVLCYDRKRFDENGLFSWHAVQTQTTDDRPAGKPEGDPS